MQSSLSSQPSPLLRKVTPFGFLTCKTGVKFASFEIWTKESCVQSHKMMAIEWPASSHLKLIHVKSQYETSCTLI